MVVIGNQNMHLDFLDPMGWPARAPSDNDACLRNCSAGLTIVSP
ncbi:MAG: hypothetical protein R3E47_12435 [Paracoccaceae bacterium]